MKIIDVAEHYAPQGGGVKTYIHNKIKAAQRHGHELIVIAPGDMDRVEYKLGAKIIWVKGPKLWIDKRYNVFNNQRAIFQILDEEDPDIIEGGSVWAGGRIVSRWKGRAKKVWIFHQDFVAAYGHTFLDRYLKIQTIDSLFTPFWLYLKKVSAGYDHTVVAGKWLAERLDDKSIKSPIAIPFGIDKEFFSPNRYDKELRNKLLRMCGRAEDVPLLITVSRFHPEKRLRTLFEAVKKVNKLRPIAHIIFGEGVLSQSDRKFAHDTEGIHLAGFTQDRDELASALASSDLLLHGSAAETFGLGVAEAICSGLPVVGPSVGGVADIIEKSFGKEYAPGNIDECAKAIIEVIDNPKIYSKSKIKIQADRIKSTEEHFTALFEFYTDIGF